MTPQRGQTGLSLRVPQWRLYALFVCSEEQRGRKTEGRCNGEIR